MTKHQRTNKLQEPGINNQIDSNNQDPRSKLFGYYCSEVFNKSAHNCRYTVIPGQTRNPEDIENPGFPIKAPGNDEKISVAVLLRFGHW
jgi:hypothetical protein